MIRGKHPSNRITFADAQPLCGTSVPLFVRLYVRSGKQCSEEFEVVGQGPGVRSEVFVWCELGGVDKEGEDCVRVLREGLADCGGTRISGGQARKGLHSPRFICPSCSAPIVGTTPTLLRCSLARRLHLRSCARSWNTGIRECGEAVSGRSVAIVVVV